MHAEQYRDRGSGPQYGAFEGNRRITAVHIWQTRYRIQEASQFAQQVHHRASHRGGAQYGSENTQVQGIGGVNQ